MAENLQEIDKKWLIFCFAGEEAQGHAPDWLREALIQNKVSFEVTLEQLIKAYNEDIPQTKEMTDRIWANLPEAKQFVAGLLGLT